MCTYRLFVCIFLSLLFQCITSAVHCDTGFLYKDRFDVGIRYLESEQYDKALATFEDIRSEEPSSGVFCYIGIVLQEQNRLSEAIEAYQNALSFNAPPEIHGIAHLHLGIAYKAQGVLNLSHTHLKNALKLSSEKVLANIHLGEVYLLQRQFENAANAYKTSIQLNPNYAEAFYGLGRLAEMQNEFSLAVDNFRLAIKQNPYLPDPHYRLSMAYRRLRKLEDAKIAMTQFQQMKKYSDNVHNFRETIYNHPNSPILYVKLGELHEKYENFSDAERVYQNSMTIYPSYSPAYHRLGELFIRQRELEKATQVYLNITKISTEDVQAWLKLGVIYINRQQFENAINAFNRAIDVDGTSAEAYNNLARVYAGLGKETQKAILVAEKAVALSPIPRHYDTLAYAYYRHGQYSKALAAINTAQKLAPNISSYDKLRKKIQVKLNENSNQSEQQ